MRFALRDDDANFFTSPDHLEAVYADLWDRHPVSLAVVPFHGCTTSGAVPPDRWSGSDRFPLHRNRALVSFLKGKARQGRVSILLHGYDHVDRGGSPEFAAAATVEDLRIRIAAGRGYLQDLLEVPVRTFVPPHNALGPEAIAALERIPMNVLGTFSFRPGLRRLSAASLAPLARRRLFLWRRGRHGRRSRFYPFPLRVGRHQELACHNLNRDPACSLDALIARLERTAEEGGDFCLAAHFWELADPPLAGRLRRLIGRAADLGARFVHVDAIFDAPAAPADGEAAA